MRFLSLKVGCTGSSESTLVKMPHCWKSHVTAHKVIVFPVAISIDIHTVIVFSWGLEIAISIDIHTVIAFQMGVRNRYTYDDIHTVIVFRWDLEIAISIDIHTVIAFQVGFRNRYIY